MSMSSVEVDAAPCRPRPNPTRGSLVVRLAKAFDRACLFSPVARRPSGLRHQRREPRTPHPARPHDALRSSLGRAGQREDRL